MHELIKPSQTTLVSRSCQRSKSAAQVGCTDSATVQATAALRHTDTAAAEVDLYEHVFY